MTRAFQAGALPFLVEQLCEHDGRSGSHRRSLSETTHGAFVGAPRKSRRDGQSQLFGLDDRFERRPDDRRKPMRAAMSRHSVIETRHRVVPIKVSHLPVADAQRCRQRGTLAARAMTAFEYGERRAHRGAVPALQHEQHGFQDLGKLPRSGCNGGVRAAHRILELRDGRQSIVDTQLDEAPPGAHEQRVWGKANAS